MKVIVDLRSTSSMYQTLSAQMFYFDCFYFKRVHYFIIIIYLINFFEWAHKKNNLHFNHEPQIGKPWHTVMFNTFHDVDEKVRNRFSYVLGQK